MRPEAFPPELLAKPPSERLEYFTKFIIGHPSLARADAKLTHILRHPVGIPLVVVLGPSGVGKTTLGRGSAQRILKVHRRVLQANPGYRPAVYFEAGAPETGNFHWPRHYVQPALEALGEPLIPQRIAGRLRSASATGGLPMPALRMPPAQDARHLVLKAFGLHGVRVCIVDEAQHLTKLASGRKLQDQMDVIKSMANTSGIPHVLLGTYELLPFLNLSGQLSRRSVHIHFPRYRADLKDDRRAFKDATWTLQHHLPVEEVEDLCEAHFDLLYEWTLGCFGIAKDLFTRAFAATLEEKQGGRAVTLAHFRECALSETQREKMIKDILAGEELLAESADVRARVRVLLGLGGDPAAARQAGPQDPRTRHPAHRVGHRKPVRDPVGARHVG